MPFLGNTTTSFNVDSNNINNGAITSEKIATGAVVNADVNDTASIAGTKISADFGAQDLIVDTNLLFVDVSEGRVGVGTSSPTVPLTVNTATDNTTVAVFHAGGGTPNRGLSVGTFSSTNDNAGAFINAQATVAGAALSLQTAGTTAIHIDSSQRVGVGTTDPGSFSSGGGEQFVVSNSGDCGITVHAGTSSLSRYLFADGTGAASYAGFAAYEHSTDSLRIGTASTDRVRIDSSGRVGIGTSSPGDYDGGARTLVLAESTNSGITIRGGTTGQGAIYFADGTTGNEAFRGRIEYSHSSDALNFGTAGTGSRVTLDSSGRLGIGTTSPAQLFHVSDGGAGGIEFNPGTTNNITSFNRSTVAYNDLKLSFANLIFGGGGATEKIRIDSSGRLLVGTSSSIPVELADAGFQVAGSDSEKARIHLVRTGANPAYLNISAGSSGNNVSNGTVLGRVNFAGYHTDGYDLAARIDCTVDAAPGNGDMPGRLSFWTSADSSASPTERLRIARTGAFGLSGANYGTSGQVLTSQGSGSAPQWASASNITQVTNQSLSGTSVVFDGLPTGIKRLVIIVWTLSFNGDSDLGIRIGDSGGLETTGYNCSTSYHQNSSYGARAATDQWRVISNDASGLYYGYFEIVKNRSDADGWLFSGHTTRAATGSVQQAAGYKNLSGTLDRVELKPYDTSKSFDQGSAAILYEV